MIYKHRNKHIFTVKSAIWLRITTVGVNQIYAYKKYECNVCKELFVKHWEVLYACTLFDKCKSYKDISSNNIFRKFVHFLQKDIQMDREKREH